MFERYWGYLRVKIWSILTGPQKLRQKVLLSEVLQQVSSRKSLHKSDPGKGLIFIFSKWPPTKLNVGLLLTVYGWFWGFNPKLTRLVGIDWARSEDRWRSLSRPWRHLLVPWAAVRHRQVAFHQFEAGPGAINIGPININSRSPIVLRLPSVLWQKKKNIYFHSRQKRLCDTQCCQMFFWRKVANIMRKIVQIRIDNLFQGDRK